MKQSTDEQFSPERFPHLRAHPISYLNVTMADAFWAPRQRTTREVSLGWVTAAQDRAGGLEAFRDHPDRYEARTVLGEIEHIKFMEAMAAVVGVEDDPDVVGLIDAWAKPLIEGQADDGYLAESFAAGVSRPPTRWEVQRGWESHEDYTIGHYIEAAIAHSEVTGRRDFLDSAIRAADNMVEALLDSDRAYTSGVPEIEQALMRLYGHTGEERYVRLCGWLLEQRGNHDGRPSYGRAHQDHVPIESQRTIEGHAVCAAYLFNGATEYIGATGDETYREALLAIWNDLVEHKMYLHGASGNLSATNEGYRRDGCNIRPDDCYGEACAAIGNFRWAHSLFALTGEARYLDVAERILYNAIPASLSLAGDSTFYTNVAQTGLPAAAGNPGAARGSVTITSGAPRDTVRFGELAISCCPPNIVRLINVVGGYLYSVDVDGVYVKHYGESEAEIPYGPGVTISQRTAFPWSGEVAIAVDPREPAEFSLRLRVPEWARGCALALNGTPVDLEARDGWIALRREWNRGDEVTLDLAMEVERVTMPPAFQGYENRAAVQRGPIVYCVEEQDVESSPDPSMQAAPDAWMYEAPELHHLYIPEDASFVAEHEPELLGGVTVLRGDVRRLDVDGSEKDVAITLIPYCVWGNRAPSEMRIWLGAQATPPQLFLAQQAGAEIGLENFD